MWVSCGWTKVIDQLLELDSVRLNYSGAQPRIRDFVDWLRVRDRVGLIGLKVRLGVVTFVSYTVSVHHLLEEVGEQS